MHVETKWDAPNDHDRDHDARAGDRYSVIDDGFVCTVFPGWFRGRADATSARVLRYKFLYFVDFHSQCGVSCVHMREILQSVNVLLNGYEYDDASCFVACSRDKSSLVGPKIYLQTQNIQRAQ